MPEYEGFVASLIDDTKAEVVIQPETAGIVGAPGVSAKVCHCASSSSQVTMEALNPVQAAVGDRIAIEVKASALIRNVGSLIGMPVLALALGWIVSLFQMNSYVFGVPITFVCIFFSLPLGIAAGVFLYKRWSRGNFPTITRIIQSRQEMASSFAEAQQPNT
jgi:hypothetical protein